MADRPPLKSYTFEGYYSDNPDESGPRTDCELAPDRKTAIRLAAVSVLEDNEWTLAGRGGGFDSLEEFHDAEITVSYEWVQDETGKVCPNCTSDNVRENGGSFGPFDDAKPILECGSCGYRHVGLGMGDRRTEIERTAWTLIGQLDAYEKLSLEHEDWDEMPELPEQASDGE